MKSLIFTQFFSDCRSFSLINIRILISFKASWKCYLLDLIIFTATYSLFL